MAEWPFAWITTEAPEWNDADGEVSPAPPLDQLLVGLRQIVNLHPKPAQLSLLGTQSVKAGWALRGQERGLQLSSPQPSLPGRLAAARGWPMGSPRLLCHAEDLQEDFPPECGGAKTPLSALMSHCAVPSLPFLPDRG